MGIQGWPRRLPVLVTLALGLAVFGIHLVSRVPQIGDSRLSSAVAWQVLHHGNLDLSDVPSAHGLGGPPDILRIRGRWLPFFPWPPMLLMLPAVALLSSVQTSGAPAFLAPPWVAVIELATAAAVVAATTLVLRRYLIERDLSPVGRRTAMVVALFFAFGSSAWSIGSRALWQQTVSMALICVALLVTGRLERHWRWGTALGLGAVLAAAAICRPTDALLAVLFVLWCGVRWRRVVAVAWPVLGAVAVLTPFLLISRSQYGTWLPPYYLPTRLSDPRRYGFLESLGVNLISPARGLLVYDPVLILAVVATVRQSRRREFTAFSGMLWVTVVAQWVVIARYGSTGGYTYGPRLMMDVLPALFVLALPVLRGWVDKPWRLRWRGTGLAVTAVIVFSVGINASGATLGGAECWNASPVSVDVQPERVWSWHDAQFLRPAILLEHGHSLYNIRYTCILANAGS